MAIVTIHEDQPVGYLHLSDNVPSDGTSALELAEGLLKKFFDYNGPIVATVFTVLTQETQFLSDARLQSNLASPIMVQRDWMAVHTNDDRLSWNIGHGYKVVIFRKQHVCVINSYQDNVLTSVTHFIRAEK